MSISKDRRAHAAARQTLGRADHRARLRFGANVLLASALAGTIVMGATAGVRQVQQAGKYALADMAAGLLGNLPFDPQMTITWHARDYVGGVREWAQTAVLRAEAIGFAERLGWGALLGLGIGAGGLGLTAGRRRRKRERLLADRILSGTRVVGEVELARLTEDRNNLLPLRLGSVAIPAALETRHLALIGTTGAGKTTALRQVLEIDEARGDTALIYDTSGEFIAHYYDPARGDIILNPFDTRGSYWNPFDEIAHPADADRIARHLITATGERDKDVWLETARILVANILRTLWQEGKRTPQALMDAMQSMPREELERWLADTSSRRIFEEGAERAASSVIFMTTRAINLLKFLRAAPRDGEVGFSFAKFFAGLDRHAGKCPWIFVPREQEHFEAVKALMALWLESAASATLGLDPATPRRVRFLLDEIADLPRVDNLARLLPEGRKYGASVILTFQAIGQMRDRYGREAAEAMLGCCNTKLFLQCADSASREWASETIGKVEVEIPTWSNTLDPRTGQPSRTLSTTRQVRAAVLESELRLPKHTGFLLLPDGLPVARIGLTDAHIRARGPARQPRFIPADVSETLWHGMRTKENPEESAPGTTAGPGPV